MAKYWTKLTDGSNSDEVNSVGELLAINKLFGPFYVQGDNIDFQDFFGIDIVTDTECIVYNSSIIDCLLKSNPHRNGFKNKIVFKDCKLSSLTLLNLSFTTISFINCEIQNIEINNCNQINELKIQKGFINSIKICERSVINSLQLNNIKYVKNTLINNCNIYHIDISNTRLEDFSCLNNHYIFSLKFDRCYFERIKFHDIQFSEKIEFTNCSNGEFVFNLCEFELNDFKVSECSFELLLYKVRAFKGIKFKFDENYLSRIHFNRCYFSEEVLFQGRMASKIKNLIITNTVFKDLVLFDDDNANSLEINESLFQKGILLPINNITKNNEISSSVWCILKNQAISRNDNIHALEYRKHELNSYSKELNSSKNKLQERIVLFFNNVSNNHGLNWARAILFTVVVWLLFYTLFVVSCNNFEISFTNENYKLIFFQKTFWSDAISYLWIPSGLSELSIGLKNSQHWFSLTIMTISYILGKVFIAYGIFQTISAFRKHGKM